MVSAGSFTVPSLQVNQSASKAKDAENADPNSHRAASAVKLAGATAMAAAVTAATLRGASPAQHPQVLPAASLGRLPNPKR